MQAIADLRGWSPLIALQIEYSPAQREGERDLIPMSAEMGPGVVRWSPLGSGALTGTYTEADIVDGGPTGVTGTGRDVALGNGAVIRRALAIADVVTDVAAQAGVAPAQAAIAWTLRNPAVTAPVVGARTVAQLQDTLGALDVRFIPEQEAALDGVSRVERGYPHDFLELPTARSVVTGDVTIRPRPGAVPGRSALQPAGEVL